MKRFVSLLLAALLVFSVTGAFAYDETREELLGEHITLTLMCRDNYYAGASFADDLPVFQAFEENQNVTLKWEVTPSNEYETVVQTRLAAATALPDMLMTYLNANTYGATGIFIDIKDMINERITPNYVEFLKDHPVMEALQTSPDGHQYQFSGFWGRGEAEGGAYGLTLRGDWLERLGLKVPTTTDELYEVLKAFKEQDANGNGDPDDEIPFADNFSKLGALATAFGCNYRGGDFDVDADGNVFFCKASEQYRDFLRFINKLYSEELLDPEFATTDDDQVEAKEAQNIIGGRFSLWIDEIPFSEQMIQSADPAGYYEMLNPLQGSNGEQGHVIASAILEGKMAITKDCKNPERALSFLDYMIFNEHSTILNNCGAEDICWQYDENGDVVFTEFVTNNPDGLSPMEAIRSTGGYHTMQFNSYPYGRRLMNSVNDRIVGFIDSMMPYIIDRTEFPASTDEEALKIGEYSRDINVLVDEMQLLFMTGEANLEDDWDTYVDTLNSLGLQEYTAIYQGMYDRAFK